jgi:hypothetical protein
MSKQASDIWTPWYDFNELLIIKPFSEFLWNEDSKYIKVCYLG